MAVDVIGRTVGERPGRSSARTGRSRRPAAGCETAPGVPVVGVGAGDPEALAAFVAALPARSRVAVVAVLDGDSSRGPVRPPVSLGHRRWHVGASLGRVRLEPDRVYVVPAARAVALDRGAIRVSVPEAAGSGGVNVDRFFRSLAEARGEQALAVILSGRGTAGTVGAAAIQSAGGLVIVQAPETAAEPDMPSSAIGAGVADRIASPPQMAAAVADAVRRRRGRFVRDVRARASLLDALIAAVCVRTSCDFTPLSHDLVEGRVRRRMRLHGLTGLEAYLRRLRHRPEEVDGLAADLRAVLRGFFRPPAVWTELGATVAMMLRRTEASQPFRAWVPACGTGEEAYALAMLLAEAMTPTAARRPVRIFATDCEGEALARARTGAYPEGIALDVSPARLRRFTTRSARGYAISEWLREMLVVGAHDLIADPPIGRLDLVVCRGVLPQLRPEAQETVIKRLHLALKPGGILLVDGDPALPALAPLFAVQSAGLGLFTRVEVVPGAVGAAPRAARARRVVSPVPSRRQRPAPTSRTRRMRPGGPAPEPRPAQGVLDEVACIDDELRAASEGLAAANARLQMTNEELSIVNVELRGKVAEVTRLNDDIADVLASTDLAMVFLDEDCRIRRFTSAATRVLAVRPADEGRPIGDVATTLAGVDLAREVREVIASRVAVEKEVDGAAGERYYLRVLPHRTEARRPAAVVTVLDVTILKDTEDELRRTRDELRLVNATLEGRVAERTRWLGLLHDVTRTIAYAPTADEALRRVLRLVCVSQCWQVGLVYQPDPSAAGTIVPTVSYAEDGERLRAFHDLARRQRHAANASLPGRVYAEGKALWTDDARALEGLLPIRGRLAMAAGFHSAAALPIVFGQQVIAVLELFSVHRHAPSLELVRLMTDVSAQIGEVLERERTTAEIADIVWREQQALLHTLHDSLGQTLTGLGMLSAGLQHRLAAADPSAADAAQQIARQAQIALEEVRQVSRGLFPVEIDPDGFVPALRVLAETTAALHGIRVTVGGELETPVRDSRVVNQLYRIAQEAVTNAVKHARAAAIGIHLGESLGRVVLTIQDDGVGIDRGAPAAGLGLRIMNHRATSIGASLTIEAGADGGTVVRCTLATVPALASVTTA